MAGNTVGVKGFAEFARQQQIPFLYIVMVILTGMVIHPKKVIMPDGDGKWNTKRQEMELL